MNDQLLFDDMNSMIAAANQPDFWLLQGLIEEGDQVILAGAPKSGKTLMASQIALAVASGGKFLSWEANTPRNVLYINLELRPKNFGKRLIAQVRGAHNLTNYQNFLIGNNLRTLNILNKNEQKEFAAHILEKDVRLVIWDVLARMHHSDENDNGAMREVMHAIRVASGDRAHIILHHLRKPPSGSENTNMGALGMRGASSIHGEADLIMTLHTRSGQGARYSLKFSARNVETPDELLLDRNQNLCFFETLAHDSNLLLESVKLAFSGNKRTCAAQHLLAHLMKTQNVQERRAQQIIRESRKKGWIKSQSGENSRYEYELLVNQADQELFDVAQLTS
ncbi:MAG: AAA family ATPase [Betaproteobacteria bacterium]|nr:AAA family ATPase [Betaproteobacteria bacterium]